MADTPTSQLPRVRTYARDLESERQRRGMPSVPTPGGKETTTPPAPPAAKVKTVLPPTPTPPTKPAPAPAKPEHIVVASPRPERISEAVLKTREDELKKEREARPTTVPPFHTLKAASRATAVAAVRETEVITIDNDESAATVITDTKRGRFSVRRSLLTLIRDWWQTRARERKARKVPKYVVPETDRRKGVIQRATSHTGRQITGDRAQLRDLIREREVNPPAHESETIWTPNTETIFELLPAPESESRFSNVSTTTRYSTVPTPHERVVVAPNTPPVITAPPPVATPAPVATPVEEPAPKPEPTTAPEPIAQPAPQPRTTPQSRATRRFDTNTLSLGIVAVVVVVGLAGIGVRTLLSPAPVVEISEVPRPVNIPLQTLEVTDGTRDTLINTLTAAQSNATLPLQLIELQGGGTAIPPRTLLSLLDEQVGNAIAGEVTALYLGWHERATPFIVLSVIDRTRIWGNLLARESTLGNTFSPLLRTTGNQSFTDVRTGSFDLRSYRSDAGTEELVYGFVNENTLVITRDQATFLLISALATATP